MKNKQKQHTEDDLKCDESYGSNSSDYEDIDENTCAVDYAA